MLNDRQQIIKKHFVHDGISSVKTLKYSLGVCALNPFEKLDERLFHMGFAILFTVIGGVATLIGVAIIILSLIFLKKNKLSGIGTGIFFSLFGFLIFWFSLAPSKTYEINL